MTVTSSTLSGNSASLGGGIYDLGGSVTMNNTIVANSTGSDLSGAFTGSNNLTEDGSGTGLVGTITGDPLLGPLADNGGPTLTHALLPGSPAINAGSNALIPAGVTTDQRGDGFDRIRGSAVDIGAFEVQNSVAHAVNDSVTTDEDTAVTIDVLANDIDEFGAPLTITGTTDPAHGTIALNPDGAITYTPDENFNGADSFTYTVVNPFGETDTATVTVQVLSPAEQIDELRATVDSLHDDGALNQGQVNALLTKLNQVEWKLEGDQVRVAYNVLGAFINQVEDLLAEGVLSPEEADLLLIPARQLRASLLIGGGF